MAYQKCPVCEGTGRVAGDMYSTSVFSTCSVCQGAKIIHSGSGFPPYQKIPKAKIYFHDFNSERGKQCVIEGQKEKLPKLPKKKKILMTPDTKNRAEGTLSLPFKRGTKFRYNQ